MLYCKICLIEHDLDLSPDDGQCDRCGGDLIQEASDVGVSAALQNAVVGAVTDGLASAAISHGTVDKATN